MSGRPPASLAGGASGALRVVLALALLGLGVPRSIAAGPLVDLLRARQARVDAALPATSGRLDAAGRRQLEEALTDLLAFDEMARDALGPEWGRRTSAEQADFAEAFAGLLRASLLRKPDIYRVDRIEYLSETAEGAGGRVHTIVRARGAATEVDYVFRRLGPGWRIVDYAVDGVSTVRNYRSQFARILTRSGWDVLLQRIRKRTTALRQEDRES